MQISAICESSPVVSSSGATFASSRSATRVISRPFQKRSVVKSRFAIEPSARAWSSLNISPWLREVRHTSGLQSHRRISGSCINRVAQMLETAKRCNRAVSPSGNCSTILTRGGALAGHRSLSWTRAVSICEGLRDAAAFSRIQRFSSSIARNITSF